MNSAQLTPEDKAKVTALRKKGEEQHKAGDRQAPAGALAQAKAILGIN